MEIKKAVRPKQKKKKVEAQKKKIDLLNPKHKEFLLNYFELGMNGRKAYLKTYPGVKNESAEVNASKLLSSAKVKEARQEILDEQWASKEQVIPDLFNKLFLMAGSDISDYIDEFGHVKVDKFKEINTYPIAQYDQTITDTKDGQNVKQSIKLMDKQKSIDTLAKILGMIQEKVEHSGTIEIKPAERPEE
jgi:phage terminase small subunit